MAIKRLNYFDHQLLVEADFTAEQRYHLDMRRRLNQRLYTAGIVDGLEVNKSGDKQVTVSPGAAIDRLGREMFLEESDQRVVDLSPFPGGTSVFIIIAYKERKSDPATTGVPGDTRVTEQPVIGAVTALPTDEQNPVVPLASFTLEANGNVPGAPDGLLDGDVRQMVRPRNEQGLARVNEVSNPGGNIELVPGTGITIEPNQDNHSIRIEASGTQGLVSVNRVSSPGGNVDLVAPTEQAIVIEPDDSRSEITIRETHSAARGNVHGLEAEHLQDLLEAGTGITISPNQTNRTIRIGTQGLLLARDYDLRRRVRTGLSFRENDGRNGSADRTVNVGFQPRLMLVVGLFTNSGPGYVHKVGTSAFAYGSDAREQHCLGVSLGRASNGTWSSHPEFAGGVICSVVVLKAGVNPPEGEDLKVTVSNMNGPPERELTTTLTRQTIEGYAQLSDFMIQLALLCMG